MSCMYLTVDEFKASPYYKTFANCENIVGENLDATISGLIRVASSMIDNYVGYKLCLSNYEEDIYFEQDDRVFFLPKVPVNSIDSIVSTSLGNNTYYGHSDNIEGSTGTITNFRLTQDIGKVQLTNGRKLDENYAYTVTYNAGYTVAGSLANLPQDIKIATEILVAHISLQIDSGQIAVAEGGNLERLQIENDVTASYGNGKLNKNIVIMSMNDLNNLPATVYKLLAKYRSSA